MNDSNCPYPHHLMPEPDPRRALLAELRQRLEELGRMVSAAPGTLGAGVTGGHLRPLPGAERRAGCLRRQGVGQEERAWRERAGGY